MTSETPAVFARADELAEALQRAKAEMNPDAFLNLLAECNMQIRRMTRIEYGAVCAPPAGGCCCGGT